MFDAQRPPVLAIGMVQTAKYRRRSDAI